MEKSVIEFDQLVKVGCGIDVHEKSLSVSISSDGKKYQTFSFGTFTEDLLCLQSLLEQANVEGIAMESTGVYWNRSAEATSVQHFVRNDTDFIS
jgi:transposase